jgi:hypothetical protein
MMPWAKVRSVAVLTGDNGCGQSAAEEDAGCSSES